MIEINLLPEELKSRKIKLEESQPIRVVEIFYRIFIILIFIHILFIALGIARSFRLSFLIKRWNSFADKVRILEEAKRGYSEEAESKKQVNQILKNRISWAEKLNCLSLDLPSGVWFNSLSFEKDMLLITASALSLERKGITSINKFIENLKNDKNFSKDFKKIQLGPIQTKDISGYEVLDFSLKIER
ncbi:MAG: PilN domain-containing protein [Candidatus Omnitrophica bacterium]|nr:PilN domain-containing protein [Candidatus Omnitrophota bacterium]